MNIEKIKHGSFYKMKDGGVVFIRPTSTSWKDFAMGVYIINAEKTQSVYGNPFIPTETRMAGEEYGISINHIECEVEIETKEK